MNKKIEGYRVTMIPCDNDGNEITEAGEESI